MDEASTVGPNAERNLAGRACSPRAAGIGGLEARPARICAAILRAEGLAHGSMRGLGALLRLGLRADGAVARLKDAVARGDRAALRAAAVALIGRGPGATPAGDDLLAGVGAVHRWVAIEVAALAAGRTTAVSEALLRDVAAGRPPWPLAALVAAERPAEVAAATRRLCGVGGSSGTDALVGVYLALGGE